ncbi:hypothetical protein GF391_02175 [Candidatus Uhrbacteria bacterium]|nr:hypothetical protein [Candidatus Uhrbacteria bacterium]
MNHKYYYLLLIPVFAFVAVVAAGFWYAHQGTKTDTQQTEYNGEQPYIHPVEAKDPDSYEARIERLQEAVQKFRNAKSFKAKIEENRDEGKLRSELAYVKPLRLQATITLNSNNSFEIIIVGETSYARYPEDDWKMTNDKIIREFGRKFFESMLSQDADITSFGIEEDAKFDIRENALDECLKYSTFYELDGNTYPISLCVNDAGELVRITKTDDEGEVITEITEYNKFFNIERPMLPLLEHTMELIILDEENSSRNE